MFLRKQRRSSFVCVAQPNAISQIRDAFSLGCAAANLVVPKPVEKEFKTRTDPSQAAAKAKLNFTKCSLTDDHAIKLIEALSVAPRLGKMELDNNFLSDKSALVMLKLLKGQAKRIRTVAMSDRLDARYLGRLSMKGNTVSATTLQNLKQYADALEYANAQTHVYNTFRAHFAIDTTTAEITYAMIETLFEPTLSRKPLKTDIAEHFFKYHVKVVGTPLNYAELEGSMLHLMIVEGGLETVTPHQIALVTPSDDDNISTVSGVDHGPVGSLASLGVDTDFHGSERFLGQVAAATASSPGEMEDEPQLVPVHESTATNPPVTGQSAASRLFGEPNEFAETDDRGVSVASAAEQLSVLEQVALPAQKTASPNQPIPLPRKPTVPEALSSTTPSGAAPSPPKSTVDQKDPKVSPRTSAANSPVTADALAVSENNQSEDVDQNKSMPPLGQSDEPELPPPAPPGCVEEVESPRQRQMRESGVVNNAISANIQKLGGRRQSLIADEVAESLTSPAGRGFSAGFNERNGVSPTGSNKYRLSIGEDSSSPAAAARAERTTSTGTDVAASPTDVSVSSPVGRRRSSAMNSIGLGSNHSTPGAVVITRKHSMSNMASPAATIEEAAADITGDDILDNGDGGAETKQVQFLEEAVAAVPADVVLQSMGNAEDLTRLIEGIKTQRQTMKEEESVLTPIAPVLAPTFPSCYDFSNQNICGDDWFVAVDAEDKEEKVETQTEAQMETKVVFSRVELVPKACFKYVKTLILSHNQIECFNWSVLLGLTNLVELDLSHNRITHIIESIVFMETFVTPNPEKLTPEEAAIAHRRKAQSQKKVRNSYNNTSLNNEDDEFACDALLAVKVLHNQLKRLDLSHNKIVDCSGLVSLVGLEELNISHNAIRSPDGIPFTTKRLDMSYNLLSSFMSLRIIGLCKAVVAIDMEGNPVTQGAKGTSAAAGAKAWKNMITSIMPQLLELDGFALARARTRHNKNLAEAEHKVYLKRLLPYQIFNLKQAKKKERAREREKQAQDQAFAAAKAEAEAEALGAGDSANLNTSVLSFATTATALSRRQSQHQSDITRSTVYYTKKMEALEAKRMSIKEHFDNMTTKSLHTTRAHQREVARRLAGEAMHITEYQHESPSQRRLRSTNAHKQPMHVGVLESREAPHTLSKNLDELLNSAAKQRVFMQNGALDRSVDRASDNDGDGREGGSVMANLFNGPEEVTATEPLPQDTITAYIQLASSVLHDLVNSIQCDEGDTDAVMSNEFMGSFREQLEILDGLRRHIETEGAADTTEKQLVDSFQYIFEEVAQLFSDSAEVVYRLAVQQVLEFLLTETDQGRVVQDSVVQYSEQTSLPISETEKDSAPIFDLTEAEADTERFRRAEEEAAVALAAAELKASEEAAATAEAERIRLVEDRLATAAALSAVSEIAKASEATEAERIRNEASAEAERASVAATEEAARVAAEEAKLVADLATVMNPVQEEPISNGPSVEQSSDTQEQVQDPTVDVRASEATAEPVVPLDTPVVAVDVSEPESESESESKSVLPTKKVLTPVLRPLPVAPVFLPMTDSEVVESDPEPIPEHVVPESESLASEPVDLPESAPVSETVIADTTAQPVAVSGGDVDKDIVEPVPTTSTAPVSETVIADTTAQPVAVSGGDVDKDIVEPVPTTSTTPPLSPAREPSVPTLGSPAVKETAKERLAKRLAKMKEKSESTE